MYIIQNNSTKASYSIIIYKVALHKTNQKRTKWNLNLSFLSSVACRK